jgi:hypothetical protein
MRSGPPHAHESYDVRFWPIVWFSLGLLLVVVLVLVVLHWMVGYWTSQRGQAVREFSALEAKQLPPAPRLEIASGAELQELRAHEEALLDSYGWVDRDAGLVRIPIERAIELIGQQGLPARSRGGPPRPTEVGPNDASGGSNAQRQTREPQP